MRVCCTAFGVIFPQRLILQSQNASIVAFYWAISLTFSLVAFLVFRLHDGISRYFSVHDALDILKAAVVSQLLTTVVLFAFTRLDGIPRSDADHSSVDIGHRPRQHEGHHAGAQKRQLSNKWS